MPNIGEARLRVELQGQRSVVTQQFGRAPLQVHAPLYLEGAAHPTVFLRSPSAGLLGGDIHRLHIEVADGASLQVCTQAATQVYPGHSQQVIEIELGQSSSLTYLPHGLILCAQASLDQTVSIRLQSTSALTFSETWCAGRIAMGERWQFHSFHNLIEIWQTEQLLVREHWQLLPQHMPVTSPLVCGEFTHFRTVYCVDGLDPAGHEQGPIPWESPQHSSIRLLGAPASCRLEAGAPREETAASEPHRASLLETEDDSQQYTPQGYGPPSVPDSRKVWKMQRGNATIWKVAHRALLS